jgi:hypothetical protein
MISLKFSFPFQVRTWWTSPNISFEISKWFSFRKPESAIFYTKVAISPSLDFRALSFDTDHLTQEKVRTGTYPSIDFSHFWSHVWFPIHKMDSIPVCVPINPHPMVFMLPNVLPLKLTQKATSVSPQSLMISFPSRSIPLHFIRCFL